MTRPGIRRWRMASLCCALVTTDVAAQERPAEAAERRLGPLRITPSLTLTFGIDTNVFNEAKSFAKDDLTSVLRPQADWQLRFGRGGLSGKSTAAFVYFRKFASERSINTDNSARLEVRSRWFTPFVSGSFLNSRERPGYEIDLRSRRLETTVTVGGDVRVSSATTAGLSARRSRINFDFDAFFLGTSLRNTLNRRIDALSASVRHALTPLTTVAVTGGVERDKFTFAPFRDAESVRVMPGVELAPSALITGRAYVGYRRFRPAGPGVPDFTGAVANVDLTYTLRGATRFGVQAERDVVYSFELLDPYYVLTGVRGSVEQHVTGAWIVLASAGRHRLAYRQSETPSPAGTGRVDWVDSYGAGLAYRIGPRLRVGVTADYYRRESELLRRRYEGLRAGTTVTYVP